jgi:uncharacterized RDD family membrane protein YckC
LIHKPIKSDRVLLDNQIGVQTPENIAFNYQVVGPFRRTIAFCLDFLITQIGFWVLVSIIYLLFSLLLIPLLASNVAATIVGVISGIFVALTLVGNFLVTWFYGAYMEAYYNGQTFGKRWTSIRVLSINGGSIDGAQAMLRNFFRLMDCMPMVSLGYVFGYPEFTLPFPTFAFGLICMTISGRYQRIGDLVAGTMVITEDKEWAYALARFEDRRVPQLAQLIPDDFAIPASLAKSLAEYVDRRRFLPYRRVEEIAAHVGMPLVARFGLPPDTNHDLLLCSLYFKAFVRAGEDEL